LLKHILFDFDGTIANSGVLAVQIINELADKHGYRKVTAEEYLALNQLPVRERFKRQGVPLYKFPILVKGCLTIYRRLMPSVATFEGIPAAVAALKQEGILLSIVSNNSVENIRSFLEANAMSGHFDHILSVKHLFGKDHSIRKFMKHHGLRPEELVYVGDELRDIEVCRKIPLRIIAVTWGFDPPGLIQSGKPDYIARRPEELLAYARSLKTMR